MVPASDQIRQGTNDLLWRVGRFQTVIGEIANSAEAGPLLSPPASREPLPLWEDCATVDPTHFAWISALAGHRFL